jgi:hypothetical protein
VTEPRRDVTVRVEELGYDGKRVLVIGGATGMGTGTS